MSLQKIEAAARAKIAAGLYASALEGAQLYLRNVTKKTEPNHPTGPFPGPHSSPGEYPYRETGQGSENIRAEINVATLEAGFGVMGAKQGIGPKGAHQEAGGIHLIELILMGRRGPDNTLLENKEQVAQAFKRAARR